MVTSVEVSAAIAAWGIGTVSRVVEASAMTSMAALLDLIGGRPYRNRWMEALPSLVLALFPVKHGPVETPPLRSWGGARSWGGRNLGGGARDLGDRGGSGQRGLLGTLAPVLRRTRIQR